MDIPNLYCPDHNEIIEFLNIKKGVQKGLRTLCKYCDFNDAKKIQETLIIWESYKERYLEILTSKQLQISEPLKKLQKMYLDLKKNMEDAFEQTVIMLKEFKKYITDEIEKKCQKVRQLNEIHSLSCLQEISDIIADDYNIENIYAKKFQCIEKYCQNYVQMLNPLTQITKGLNQCTGSLSKLQKAMEQKVTEESGLCLVYFIQGQQLFKSGDYDRTIEYCDKALKINSKHDEALRLKGIALQQLEKPQAAIQCFDEAISLNPENSNTFSNKGNALQDLQRYEESLICYDLAIRLNSHNSNAFTNKGVALHYLHRLDEAIQCYNIAIEINPNNRYAIQNLDISLAQKNKVQQALESEQFLESEGYSFQELEINNEFSYHGNLLNFLLEEDVEFIF